MLENKIYDLVLLDIMLPKIDGYELLKYIKQVSDIPIIFITAKTQTKDIINRIMKKEIPITRKLDRKGYIFNDDLEIVSVEAEVIQYLLEYCLNRKIEFGQEFGQQARAIYYDKDFVRRDGRKIGNMVEELYNEHFGIK